MIMNNKPLINIGPGDWIKNELEYRNWTQEDLADIIGLSLTYVNRLITHKQNLTFDLAVLLSKAFNIPVHMWLNIDTAYRLRLQPEKQETSEAEIKAQIYNIMPVKEMVQKKWLKPYNNIKQLIKEVQSFWNIDNLDFSFLEKNPIPNLRKSDAFGMYNEYYTKVWFNMAKKCAEKYNAGKYNEIQLKKLGLEIPQYSDEKNEGAAKFLNELEKAGIKFFVLSHLQKTYIDGASFFCNGNPVIVYTKRYDRIDNFWFTIAHEIAHVLLHLKKKSDFFIDDIGEINTNIETEADKLACRLLKVNEILDYFKSSFQYIYKDNIQNCSEQLRINTAIVVGVLQHYKKIERKQFNQYKVKISEFIPGKYFIENTFN